MEEEEANIQIEKESQLKILSQLDYSSYATNKQDVKEEEYLIKEKPSKRFKINQNTYKQKQPQKVQINPQKLQNVSSNWKAFLSKQNDEKQATVTSQIDQQDKGNQLTNEQQLKKQSKDVNYPQKKSLEPESNSFKGETPIIAIDCEMVQCDGNEGVPTQELARVSIVNFNGHVLLDSYVRPQKKIRNYLTSVSGITFPLIKNAPTLQQLKEKIEAFLKDKTIVGHSIDHDIQALKYTLSGKNQLRDISNFKELRNSGKKVSLKKMVKQQLGINFQEGQHDSIADARAALLVYKKYQKQMDLEQSQKK